MTIEFPDYINRTLNIPCQDGIKLLPDNSVDMVITSPPYWGQRSYGCSTVFKNSISCKDEEHEFINYSKIYKSTDGREEIISKICKKCNCYEGELGQEPFFELYIEHLVSIFDSCKDKLKDDGSLYVNISDTFSKGNSIEMCACDNVKKKSLCMIPERFSIEMIKRGWILRNKIIWHKPNAMPNAVKDRYTIDYENLFFFTKSQKYYFDQQLEPYEKQLNRRGGNITTGNESKYDEIIGQQRNRERKIRPNENGRNKRSIWSINTQSSQNKHCAVFPEELVKTPILASCRDGGIVLDPFHGSGTTGKVANKLGRDYIAFEIN